MAAGAVAAGVVWLTGGRTDAAPAVAPALSAAASSVAEPTAAAVAAAPGRTFYVSASGSDRNDGTTPTRAWRTVGRVNRATLRPGDRVLFEGGSTFADRALMPPASGTRTAHIVFASYGSGRAILGKGIAFTARDSLTFSNLAIRGPDQGVSASRRGAGSDDILIQGLRISDVGIGINSANAGDDDWRIQDTVVARTGDSGLILLGSRFVIARNRITDTGIDDSITYGKHGIYLKVIDARVVGNVIRRFSSNGISVRYRNSTIEDNEIDGGPIGVAWFQYDPVAGTSRWLRNRVSNTTSACFYVSDRDVGGPTRESFVIEGNTMSKLRGGYTDLEPTTGTYSVRGNVRR